MERKKTKERVQTERRQFFRLLRLCANNFLNSQTVNCQE